MKTTRFIVACIAVAFAFAGCMTSDMRMQQKGIGKTVTFTTTEPAPAEFDSWTFFWQCPSLERFDADLEYVVLLPDGKEYCVHNCGMTAPGGSVRSDFWKDMFKTLGEPERDMIAPFHGQHISIMFRATTGRLRFPPGGGGGFAFYKKGEEGKVDRDHPVKSIDAVMK